MESPKVQLIGVYPVYPTHQTLVEAVLYYGGSLSDVQKVRLNCDKHHGLCLLELEVDGLFSVNSIEHHTRRTVQVPYLEFYLDATGKNLIYQPKKHNKLRTFDSLRKSFEDVLKSTSKRRLCFFIHFLNSANPLFVDNIGLLIPEKSVLPERLIPFTHYVPVD